MKNKRLFIAVAALMAAMLILGACSPDGAKDASDPVGTAEHLAEVTPPASLTLAELMALDTRGAYSPLAGTDDELARAITDAVHLTYFTPSPFYAAQNSGSYGELLARREAEALAMAKELITRAGDLVDVYRAMCEAFIATLDSVTDSGGDRGYEYDKFLGHAEVEMNAVLFNLDGYAAAFSDWESVAAGVSAPFHAAQARHFQILLGMVSGLEIIDGIERIAVQAEAFSRIFPDAGGAAERSRAIDGLSAQSDAFAEVAAMTAALARISHNAVLANNARALAMLGEKIRATESEISNGTAPPEAEAWLAADIAVYNMFRDMTAREGVYGDLRPLSDEGDGSGGSEAANTEAYVILEDSPAAISAGYAPIMRDALETFLSSTLGQAAGWFVGSDAEIETEARLDALRLTFDRSNNDHAPPEWYEHTIDAAVPAVEIYAMYRHTLDRYYADLSILEKIMAQVDAREEELTFYSALERAVGDFSKIADLSITPLSADSGVNADDGQLTHPIYTPQSGGYELTPLAGIRIYADGSSTNDVRCSSYLNFLGNVAGHHASDPVGTMTNTFGNHLLMNSFYNIGDPRAPDAMERLAAATDHLMEAMMVDFFNWMMAQAAEGRHGIAIGIARIEIVIDLTDEFRPNPPQSIDRYSGNFHNLLASGRDLLTLEELRYYSWRGTYRPTRMRATEYSRLIPDMLTYDPSPPDGAEAVGMTRSTYEIKQGLYQAMVEATEGEMRNPLEVKNLYPKNEWGYITGDNYVMTAPLIAYAYSTVYVEEIRANIRVGYGMYEMDEDGIVPFYDPRGFYVIIPDEDADAYVHLIPYIDDSGRPKLTGLMNVVYWYGPSYIEVGFEIEMDGEFLGMPADLELSTTSIFTPRRYRPPGPPQIPKLEDPVKKDPPRTPGSKTQQANAINITGQYEGTATLIDVGPRSDPRFNYDGVARGLEGFRNGTSNYVDKYDPARAVSDTQRAYETEQLEYWDALNEFLGNSCGPGTVREIEMDLLRRVDVSAFYMPEGWLDGIPRGSLDGPPEYSSHEGFKAYPHLQPPPVEWPPGEGDKIFDNFLIRDGTFNFTGYSLSGMSMLADVEILVDTLDHAFLWSQTAFGNMMDDERWTTTIYEHYTLELTASIRGNRLELNGTLTWRHSACQYILVYDVHLVRTEAGIPYV
ncbi:MAG: hypothetical protein FWH17_08565 [Oscillospiraceae bacterium]|nr:hypothetical protein [Oscillospiraceae bacterium]